MKQVEIRDFLAGLERSNFSLIVRNEQLILKGDRKKLTNEQIDAVKKDKDITGFIREYKKELIGYLSALSGGSVKKIGTNISAIYPLSSLQEGMLFHGLYDQAGLTYLQQFSCRISGIHPEIFRKSWNHILQGHTILRSGFYYESFNMPVQCVFRRVDLPFGLLDCRDRSPQEQDAFIEEYKKTDREKGFDFKTPPLMRVALIRQTEDAYCLVWTFHHIILDGWSTDLLFEEFLTAYHQIAAGKPLVIHKEDEYEDYIRYLGNRNKQQEEQYWRHYFEGVTNRCLLPFIRETPERSKGLSRYEQLGLRIDQRLTSTIEAFAARQRITVNTIMQAVWSFLLYSYTGNKRVIFGVPVSGRPHDLPGVERRVGMYINTLPFHTYVDEDRPVAEWLQQIQQEQSDSREYQHVPLAGILQWVGIPGDLFDTLLVFENYPVSRSVSSGQWQIQIENIQMLDPTTYPLSLAIDASNEINIRFSYNTELLDLACVWQISRHFYKVLEELLASEQEGSAKVGDMLILTGEEREKILGMFNATVEDHGYEGTIAGLFERRSAEDPYAEALVEGHRSVSYGELNRWSNRLARYLRRHGVAEGSLVPVCIGRSVELVVGILGILKAGGAYVPLDPSYPPARLAYMLEDTGSDLVVSCGSCRGLIARGVRVISVDEQKEEMRGEEDHDLGLSVGGGRLGYVIYTSGSTGHPKGVSMPEQGLVNLLLWHESRYGKGRRQRVLQYASINFDASFQEIFSALCFGGRVIMIGEEERKDMGHLLRLIDKEKVQDLFIPYVVLRTLCGHGVEEGLYPAGLERIYTAGEQLRLNGDMRLFSERTGMILVNYYGPSETHVVSWYEVQAEDYGRRPLPPIGRPVSNTEMYILNEQGGLCGIGIAGEICIGGVQVAQGYWKREGLTAERFGEKSWAPGRLYRTGDRGRWLPDGNIEFIGRVDDQLKIRGNRVEPGEVEALLLQSREVDQAVVVGRDDGHGQQRLVGYIVGKEGLDKERVLGYLRSRLPEYLVPSVLVELERLPLTANGKVDRKRLPEVGREDVIRRAYQAAGSRLEREVSLIWERLLGVEGIGMGDNFFELGGHSLLATRVVSAIRRELGRELTIRDLFSYPTVGSLSVYLSGMSQGDGLPALTRQERPARIPLSYAQERLWFIDRLEGSLQYHIPAVLRLSGNVNRAGLQAALRSIVNRHEVLRTVFQQEEGVAFQKVLDKDGWDWEPERAQPGHKENDSLQEYIKGLIGQPFDLSADHMLRAWLLEDKGEDGGAEQVLVVVLHHIASDGWSLPILVRELEELYRSFTAGRPAELPPIPLQYADYALWQRRYLEGDRLSGKLKYWTEQLKGVPVLELPEEGARAGIQGQRAGAVTLRIDRALTDRLQTLGHNQGSTLFMTLLAAFKVLLYRNSGQTDICVGSPVAGRQYQEVEGLIGFFINTLALRTGLEGNPGFTELLQRVRTTTLDAYDNQEVPFEKIVGTIVKDRDTRKNPLFQVMFVLQNNASAELGQEGIGDLKIRHEAFAYNPLKFDLSFTVSEPGGAGGLWIGIEYNADLYGKATVDRMAAHYSELLASVAANAQCPIDELKMIPAEEQQCLEQFNNTAMDYGDKRSLLDWFDEQVAATPDAPALLSEETAISYHELNERAGRLARCLWRQGVRSEMLVPLCIPRSIEMIIGILGILRTGAAYVAIDTDYPEERIRYIIKDVASGIVLTDRSFSAAFRTWEGTMPVCIEDSEHDPQPDEKIDRGSGEDHLVCIVYTSGSSGSPKGARIFSKGILNRLHWMWTAYPFENGERSALKTSLGFGDHIWELFGPLLKGIPSVLFRKEDILDLDVFLERLRQHKITRLVLVPSLLAALLDRLLSGQAPLPHIKYWTCSGEALSHKLVGNFYNLLSPGQHKLLNIYGSTEVTADAACFDTSGSIGDYQAGENAMSITKVLIGKPIANTKVYILSQGKSLAPIGIPGECWVGGPGVTPGYLNLPELTAEKFIEDRLSLNSTSRLYRTGDIARWLPDGNIEYMGRMDEQLKIRGYRIEPGEIEETLLQSGWARQAAVIAWGKEQDKLLVAYVAPAGPFDKAAMIDALKNRLPEYMVPSIFIEIKDLPLNTNGKIDRKKLPEPDPVQQLSNTYTPPRNKLEEQLVTIWKELLPVSRLGVLDNFFEAGGHSLLATRLASSIRRSMGLEITIRQLFDHPTIAQLAIHIADKDDHTPMPAIRILPRPEKIPLSFAQERLWFIDKLQGSIQYHMPWIFRMDVAPDSEVLQWSFRQIVNRHEILRTVIIEEDGIGYQVITPADQWEMQTLTLEEGPAATTSLDETIQALLRQPFDLARDPMLRATLIRSSASRYALVIVLHHIAFDGWSVKILAEELTALYRSRIMGREPALQPVAVQYADYSLWQQTFLSGQVLDNKLNYWKERLRGLAPLELMTDFPRPDTQSIRGGIVQRFIRKETADRLTAVSLKEGATLFMTLLSTLKILLYRYTGQPDICVGSPIAGRLQYELEGTIGFFVNTIPLRSSLDAAMSFRELLGQVRDTSMDAYTHQDVPFEKIVGSLELERDLRRSPVFQVSFALQNTADAVEPDLGGIRLAAGLPGQANSRFDISLHVTETANGLHTALIYCSDLFLRMTAEHMVGHFEQLLVSIAQTPDLPIGMLGMLIPSERQRMLTAFNTSTVHYPPDKTMIDLFEQQVEKTPQAIALVFEDRRLTYKELDAQASLLGNYLRDKGVQNDTIVPLCLGRSAELIIAILGILKARGAYAPLDPSFPPDRIAYMIRDTAAQLVIAAPDSITNWPPDTTVEMIMLDEGWQQRAARAKETPPADATPSGAAYLIYTSGSTGYPKGVVVEDRGLSDHVHGLIERAGLQKCRSFALFASLSADAGHAIVFSSLLTGGTLHMLSDNLLKDGEALAGYVRKEKIDCIKIVPSLWLSYAENDTANIVLAKKIMIFGGETFTANTFQRLASCGYRGEAYNHYGPTEATIGKCIYKIDLNRTYDDIPIGAPFSNTRIYVLDAQKNLVPQGVAGELFIAGDGIARGYLNRPELTAEKFLPDPFAADPGERMYRTGDRVRWLPEGVIGYIGRVDDQVKIRGYRIEPGEIQRVLIQSGLVDNALVVAKKDAAGYQYLIGYIAGSPPAGRKALFAFLKERLPEYMIPSLLVEIEKIPLLPNGKIDRTALPDPGEKDLSRKEYIAPQNSTEIQLASIWESLLNIPQLGIHDNFFELGGHSLLATRTVSAIRKQMKTELSVRDIFIHPTIGQLAAYLRQDPKQVLLPAIGTLPRPSQIPLSYAQERLYLIDRLEGSVRYHIPVVLRLKGELRIEGLQYALRKIVNRHEVLRTVIWQKEGIPFQQIMEKNSWDLEIINDMQYRNSNTLREYIRKLIDKPFNLSADHMLRAHLILQDDHEYVLVVVMHHIASDGWSQPVIVRELDSLYRTFIAGAAPGLDPLPVQYADYAIWQRKFMTGDTLVRKLAWWQHHLADLPNLDLPADYPRPPIPGIQGDRIGTAIGKELTRRLRTLGQEEGATLFMTLLAALNVLLYRYSGQKDICIGSPIAGRQQQEVEGLIGFFINTLALRSDLSGDPCFRSLLQRVRDTTLTAYDNQEVPFEKIVEAVVKERDTSRNPLFQVMFNLQQSAVTPARKIDREANGTSLLLSVEHNAHTTAKFDLSFSISEEAEGLQLDLEYSTALYRKETALHMLQHYQQLLQAIVKEPDRPVSHLQMLTETEEHLLGVGFNDTAMEYPRDRTVVDLIAEQTARTPDAVALLYGEEKMSYRELDLRSNRLAHYLRRKGVKEESLVPLCSGRSMEMIIGILGILKAGAAYVPIDPGYPPGRMMAMLQDTNSHLIVTTHACKGNIEDDWKGDKILLDTGWEEIGKMPEEKILLRTGPDRLIYVIYTSGSTGIPKGAGVYHHSFTNLIQWYIREFSISKDDRNLIVSSIGFDLTQKNFFSTLAAGGVLVIPAMEYYDIHIILKEIREKEVTLLNCAPSAFYPLVDEGNSFKDLRSLRLVVLGGEPILLQRLTRWQHHNGTEVVNSYGPTECTDISTYHRIQNLALYADRSIPIGRPIDNVRIYIMDGCGQLQPTGVIGELCVAGASIGAGYINDKELSDRKFMADPFGSGKLYHTGDLCRRLPDGNIEYIGRVDDQVKIRGNRVEPGEVNEVLSRCPGVDQCAVIAEDGDTDRRLVGYVVARPPFDRRKIFSFLRTRLPEYMVPAVIVRVDNIPLTNNGKIDRKKLFIPDEIEDHPADTTLDSEAELSVIRVWQEILNQRQVGIHDNFFELGGNSLRMIVLSDRLTKLLNEDITMLMLFQYPTIRKLLDHLGEMSDEKNRTENFDKEELLNELDKFNT